MQARRSRSGVRARLRAYSKILGWSRPACPVELEHEPANSRPLAVAFPAGVRALQAAFRFPFEYGYQWFSWRRLIYLVLLFRGFSYCALAQSVVALDVAVPVFLVRL